MIDIHCHILPGVDDGSTGLSESIEMAKIASSEGIKKIVNTSHYHFDFKYKKGNELKSILNEFNKVLKDENINIEVILGNELYYTEDLIGKLDELDFFTINDSRYLLIEFSPINLPKNLEDVVYEIRLKKYIPILAHVERYKDIQDNPNLIYDLIKEGALIQVNASSILGKNGKEAKEVSEILIRNDMVHFIGTDAHSSTKRRPLLKEAYMYIKDNYSEEKADLLFKTNAGLVIENLDINIEGPIKYKEKRGFLRKLFKK
ncbi:MAG: tyrosine-protein phosphatase [Paraclostridium sp.]